jgi:hypothetical protein
MAGYFGSGPRAVPHDTTVIPASALQCGRGQMLLDHGVEVSDNRYALPCPAQGGGAMGGSDVLTVRRASSQQAQPEPGRMQLLTSGIGSAAPTQLRNLLIRSYYVARSADNDSSTPALRVKSLSAISGRPAFIDTEVMPGIESLQVELQPDPVNARLAIVTLTVRADAADQRAGEPLRRLAVTRHFRLRNVH